MMLTAAVSAEAVLHHLQSQPAETLRPRQNLAVVHHVQKIDQETQTQTFETSFPR